ncbi:MAG: hypothetical protein GY703_01100 [Gammaproteobacteria bacterium]|nr:hypothetical protein [Gammaproteobacteria bacterium]
MITNNPNGLLDLEGFRNELHRMAYREGENVEFLFSGKPTPKPRLVTAIEARLNELHTLERTTLLLVMAESDLSSSINRFLALEQSYQALLVLEVGGSIQAVVSRSRGGLTDSRSLSESPVARLAF